MAISIGSHVSAGASASASVTTAAVAITGGNDIVVGISCYSAVGAIDDTSVTDSVGNTYTLIGHNTVTTANKRYSGLYYAKNVTGGASVTFTFTVSTANDYPHIFVLEIQGCDTSAPYDVSGFGGSSSAAQAAITTASITTGTAAEILVGVANNGGASATGSYADGGCATNTGAWTKIEEVVSISGIGGSLGYAIVSATGTYCLTVTNSVGTQIVGDGIASFKAAAAGGGLPFFMQQDLLVGGMQSKSGGL